MKQSKSAKRKRSRSTSTSRAQTSKELADLNALLDKMLEVQKASFELQARATADRALNPNTLGSIKAGSINSGLVVGTGGVDIIGHTLPNPTVTLAEGGPSPAGPKYSDESAHKILDAVEQRVLKAHARYTDAQARLASTGPNMSGFVQAVTAVTNAGHVLLHARDELLTTAANL